MFQQNYKIIITLLCLPLSGPFGKTTNILKGVLPLETVRQMTRHNKLEKFIAAQDLFCENNRKCNKYLRVIIFLFIVDYVFFILFWVIERKPDERTKERRNERSNKRTFERTNEQTNIRRSDRTNEHSNERSKDIFFAKTELKKQMNERT